MPVSRSWANRSCDSLRPNGSSRGTLFTKGSSNHPPSHPLVPAQVVKSLTQGYIGHQACKSIGTGLGVDSVMEIKEGVNGHGQRMAVGLIVKSLVGAYYQERGAKAARTLCTDTF